MHEIWIEFGEKHMNDSKNKMVVYVGGLPQYRLSHCKWIHLKFHCCSQIVKKIQLRSQANVHGRLWIQQFAMENYTFGNNISWFALLFLWSFSMPKCNSRKLQFKLAPAATVGRPHPLWRSLRCPGQRWRRPSGTLRVGFRHFYTTSAEFGRRHRWNFHENCLEQIGTLLLTRVILGDQKLLMSQVLSLLGWPNRWCVVSGRG